MNSIQRTIGIIVLTASLQPLLPAVADVTAISYQGRLLEAGQPASGSYDIQFALYDDPALGNQVGLALTNESVVVSQGLFATSLDFGAGPFNGQPRWLHIAFRPAGSLAPFQPVFPRQPLLASPHAVHAANATTAKSVSWEALTDVPTGFADGTDNDTLYTAGTGLNLVGTTFSLANGGVGPSHLANGAVTSLKLADGAALAEIADDDGPGSGLNADLLDGQDSATFAPRSNPTFTGRVTTPQLRVDGEMVVDAGTSTARFKVHPSGGISLGTTNRFFSSPSAIFINGTMNVDGEMQVSAGTNAYRFQTGSDGNFELWWQRLRTNGSSGTLRMILTTNGLVGIGVLDPEFRLHVNGTAGKPGGGSWSVASDARLKKNVQAIRGALNQLLTLHGVHFEYANPEAVHELGGQRTGLIAQEVEKVFPDWVEIGPDGFKRLTVRGFEALVIEALRELRAEKQERIEVLEKDLADLKAKVSRLVESSAH